MGDMAEYTAHVALDDQAPRYLRIAADTVSAADVRAIASRETGETYRLFRAGGIGRLNRLIGITRFFAPGEHSLYPAWQGMQYMRDMMQGRRSCRHTTTVATRPSPGLRWRRLSYSGPPHRANHALAVRPSLTGSATIRAVGGAVIADDNVRVTATLADHRLPGAR